ncbi:cytochrome C peroxidase [Chitinophaga pendula]|uniref:cytochrome c peroxidase n=1 Tax=Chitinophaga TaxID=79328 RepID=UPI000BAF5525|nr:MULTISPECIES: cytochrome c peroxidase [Chitinophaga]ASZ14495.1 cytochrome-c peroxidase [Chitinophaga sp. MD30]UCJ07848.1 cytochrome C peroxidase [Chitinophaga pendula]
MKTYLNLVSFFIVIAGVYQLRPPVKNISPAAQAAETYFQRQLLALDSSLGILQGAIRHRQPVVNIQNAFRRSRLAYKKTEFLLEYYYPHLIRQINGPALPFADGENSREELPPEGFQVIEEQLFPSVRADAYHTVLPMLDRLRQHIFSVAKQQDEYGFQDTYVFDAMRLEIYRVIALGISGYDSPIAQHSLPEAAAALAGVRSVCKLYTTSALPDSSLIACNQAIRYLCQPTSFLTFDRLTFIARYANPLSAALLSLQQRNSLMIAPERRVLRPDAPHLFASAYYDPNVYSPNKAADATPEKIVLGARLFSDVVLSGNGQRSCASCHQPQQAFTDGLPKSLSMETGVTLARNAPTLWNAAFQPKQFYDSRAVFMERQVFDVVHNRNEMNGSLETAARRIQQDSMYVSLFRLAFRDDKDMICADNIANALAAYMRSLVSLYARFDRYMAGVTTAMSAMEKKGFNLFMGKAKCGTCHFVPFFNGVAPPYFSEAESEVLGVPATASKYAPQLDPDPGKYALYQIPIQRFAFKTPTLRNIALTAPYMHNGIYNSLEEVIDFYDNGGGAGLDIAPDNQTLPAEKLHLSDPEKKALVAFMHTLTDTSHTLLLYK